MDPLPCDLCANKASVYFTQIIHGKMQSVNLCAKCAKEKGVTDPTGFALADLLFGMSAEETSAAPTDGRCPSCGLTTAQLKKTGRVGCDRCYDVFADTLDAILSSMHKGREHKGKVPAGLAARRQHSRRVAALRAELDKAIAEERYEDAAEIRDALVAASQPATAGSQANPNP